MYPPRPLASLRTLPSYDQPLSRSAREAPPAYQQAEPRDAQGFPALLPPLPLAAQTRGRHVTTQPRPSMPGAFPTALPTYSGTSTYVARSLQGAGAAWAPLPEVLTPPRQVLRRSPTAPSQLEAGHVGFTKNSRSYVRRHACALSIAAIGAIVVGTSFAVRYA